MRYAAGFLIAAFLVPSSGAYGQSSNIVWRPPVQFDIGDATQLHGPDCKVERVGFALGPVQNGRIEGSYRITAVSGTCKLYYAANPEAKFVSLKAGMPIEEAERLLDATNIIVTSRNDDQINIEDRGSGETGLLFVDRKFFAFINDR